MQGKKRWAMVALSTILLTASWAIADDDGHKGEEHDKNKTTENAAPATVDPVYIKECGACHFPFPVGMLPDRSWRAMMADLPHHFGEDATLPEKVAAKILDYAVANAGERSKNRLDRYVASSVKADQVPLRISEVPFFVKEHTEVAKHVNAKGPVSHWSSCPLCHTKADSGSFDEHEVKIPQANK